MMGNSGGSRPYCICHMISSIDGRLLVDRWTPHVDGSKSSRVGSAYESTGDQLDGDAFIIGRTSMSEFDGVEVAGPSVADSKLRASYRAPGASGIWAVVIDSKAKLHYAKGDVEGSPIVCVLSDAVTNAYLEELRSKGISYLFAGTDGRDIVHALAELHDTFGVERLLLEGGGATNGTFFEAGLVDEISLLIYPGIDGRSGGPAIVEAGVPADKPLFPGLQLRHTATQTLDDGFVWIRYAVEGAATDH